MRRSLARFSGPDSLDHTRSSADCITTMVGFKVFGTHKFDDPEVRPAGPTMETEWSDVKAVEETAERVVEKSTHFAMKRPEWIGQLGALHRGVVATHWCLSSVLRNELSHAHLLLSPITQRPRRLTSC